MTNDSNAVIAAVRGAIEGIVQALEDNPETRSAFAEGEVYFVVRHDGIGLVRVDEPASA